MQTNHSSMIIKKTRMITCLYNPYIVNQTGQVEMSNYKNNYESGFSSIYNSAVLDRIHASDISVSDTLFLDQSSAMYVAEPEQADMARTSLQTTTA